MTTDIVDAAAGLAPVAALAPVAVLRRQREAFVRQPRAATTC